jgi:hypothetical protein
MKVWEVCRYLLRTKIETWFGFMSLKVVCSLA